MYPDPNFKAKHHKRRMITAAVVTHFASVLKPGDKIYLCTDVFDVAEEVLSIFDASPYFTQALPEEREEVVNKFPCLGQEKKPKMQELLALNVIQRMVFTRTAEEITVAPSTKQREKK